MNNLVLRSLTGIVFVAVLVGSIAYSDLTFGLLFLIITVLATAEFCHIVNQREDVEVNTFITSLSSGFLFLAFYTFASQRIDVAGFAPYILSLLYLIIAELYLKKKNPIHNWAYTLMSQLYIALPFSLLCILAFQADPAHPYYTQYRFIFPLSVFIFLWASDSGAYCVGSLLHKVFPAKLFPRVSPNKSWVGSIGGGLIAMAVGVALSYYDTSLSLLEWIGLALVVTVFGTWGDLVESLMKRTLGIKDSGHILPGHGGLLDRFDSSLLAIPASVIYLYILTMLHY